MDRVEYVLLALGESGVELEDAAHDLVGRRLPHAARDVGSGIDAHHMARGRDSDQVAGRPDRIGYVEPGIIDRAARAEIGRAPCRKECRCRWWQYHEKKEK